MNIETYKKAYRAALIETRKEFSDERDAKDHASAIATAVAGGTPVRDSAAARAAKKAVA